MRKAKMVLHHDDPPCEAKLVNGHCPECGIHPDMQSTAIWYYCPDCGVPLKKGMRCPKCGGEFSKNG